MWLSPQQKRWPTQKETKVIAFAIARWRSLTRWALCHWTFGRAWWGYVIKTSNYLIFLELNTHWWYYSPGHVWPNRCALSARCRVATSRFPSSSFNISRLLRGWWQFITCSHESNSIPIEYYPVPGQNIWQRARNVCSFSSFRERHIVYLTSNDQSKCLLWFHPLLLSHSTAACISAMSGSSVAIQHIAFKFVIRASHDVQTTFTIEHGYVCHSRSHPAS